MKIIASWLREFVSVPADDRQLADDLTLIGIAAESVHNVNGETVYEMDITTNRVDAMNHYGVAREAAAYYNAELKPVAPKLPEPGGTPKFAIEIEDSQGCARYTARIIRNVKIGASPDHVVKRLALLDSRSINNIADASNYALFEYGHPTHAFDLDTLQGGKIIVRRARAGEKLKTLDGVDRKLTPEDLVIADANRAVALAGVMGGYDTMITERTKNVLIESAWFDPVTIRATAKRLGMHTDASHRFERGADYGFTPKACARVAELIMQTAGGQLDGGEIDAVARKPQHAPVQLRRTEIDRILGAGIPDNDVERILRRLGFGLTPGRAGSATTSVSGPLATKGSGGTGAAVVEAVADYMVQIPSWRLDVEREIDVIEEIARVYGYNKFPNTLPSWSGGVVELPNAAKVARVQSTLRALGYDEAISITFISHAEAAQFGKGEPMEVANPLSEEASCLRNSLVPGMLGMIEYNLNRGTDDIRLYEVGDTFEKLGERCDERRALCFAATGNATSGDVHEKARPYNFFDVKGAVESLLAHFAGTSYYDAHAPAYYHPGRSARVVLNGATVGYLGQLHPEVAAARKLRQDVYLAEIQLQRLFEQALREPAYKAISRFPAVERDFSFVFDNAVTFDRVRSSVASLNVAAMTALAPVEIFRGGAVPQGKYSVLLRATFQSVERTLRDDEVAAWSQQIIKALEALGGTLRH
jgi:phenylalanyl-tRNA synthetase beta chain